MLSRFVRRSCWAITTAVIVGVCTGAFSTNAVAQVSPDTMPRGRMGGGGGRGGDGQGPSRQMIELFQKNYEKMLRERVLFTDEQIVKWRAWNARFDAERKPIFSEDREIRRTLRMQLARGATPDEAKVTDAMDRWAKLERRRLALKERENKELAAFLSPIQRARFFAFQDEVERTFREADGRRDGGRGDGPGGNGRGGSQQFRGDSMKFRGMRGDSAGGKFQRGGPPMRLPGKVDTLPLVAKPKNS